MPNRMADGSVVCSCTAERALPLDLVGVSDPDGGRSSLPAPVDDTGAPQGRGPLPADTGQFGRDVATEDFAPLRPPPGG